MSTPQAPTYHVAADFGASSGRVMVGTTDGTSVQLEELHRFPNQPIRLHDRLYWDFPALFQELKEGLRKAFARYGKLIRTIGVDTWGVDYGLLDAHGRLLSNPVSYRDARTEHMLPYAFTHLPAEAIYSRAANQLMPINTLFQLLSAQREADPTLTLAHHLLFMPDLFNYFLTGKRYNEYTIATTSGLLSSHTQQWDNYLFRTFDLPRHLMQPIIYPGHVIGQLTPEVAAEVGGNAYVVAVGSHDTASAVAAVPATPGSAYISCGTWSLMGVVLPKPIVTPAALQAGFTNEGTVDGRIRFLTNITGLWLLQQVEKEWKHEGLSFTYDQLISEAQQSTLPALVNPDDPAFAHPASMRRALVDYCRQHQQPEPITPPDFMRLICRSLAHRYGEVAAQLKALTGMTDLHTIHMIGGGARNAYLRSLTAQATGCTVLQGPTEATAEGNVRLQAQASLPASC